MCFAIVVPPGTKPLWIEWIYIYIYITINIYVMTVMTKTRMWWREEDAVDQTWSILDRVYKYIFFNRYLKSSKLYMYTNVYIYHFYLHIYIYSIYNIYTTMIVRKHLFICYIYMYIYIRTHSTRQKSNRRNTHVRWPPPAHHNSIRTVVRVRSSISVF